jgi:uncharacterized protein YbaP (TraB family)
MHTDQVIANPAPGLFRRRHTGSGAALLALLGFLAPAALLAPAPAAAAAAPAAEPPMWVVKDADSTIYLFGTVHLLDPSIQWQTKRVLGALDEATELWVEIAIPPGGEMALGMTMLQRALSPSQPLSSRLNETERAQLRKLLARSPDAQSLGMVIEMTKPWFATVTLGILPLMSAGYDPTAGADMVLTRLAREQGDEVKGLETAEQQLDWIAAGTDAEQLAALKSLLAMPDAEFDAMTKDLDGAVRAWMKGDIKPLEGYVDEWRKGESGAASAGMSYDTLIVGRNENWAGQIQELLKGKGVAMIAVGSGHLVGPDSVLAKLAARGVRSSSY